MRHFPDFMFHYYIMGYYINLFKQTCKNVMMSEYWTQNSRRDRQWESSKRLLNTNRCAGLLVCCGADLCRDRRIQVRDWMWS